MRGFYRLAAVSAASFSILVFASPGAAQGSAPRWRLVDRQGDAPERSLLFLDPDSLKRAGDKASARAALVFERPQDGGIKAFEVSYDFRCGAGQQRRRDIVFTQADGATQPSALSPASWSSVSPGTPAATIRAIACGGAIPSGAPSIAGTPFASASRFFAVGQTASAAPARTPPRLVPRGELLCRQKLGESVQHISQNPGATPSACRSGASAAPSARPVAQCDGTVYVDGRAAGRFSARVTLNYGFGALVEFTPDPYGLSGDYLYADGVMTEARPRRSHFSMRYNQARRRFEASTLVDVTRQASPELALQMEGNPYADVAVRDSAQGRLIADCIPG